MGIFQGISLPSSNATSRFVPYAEASAWYRAEGVTSSAQLRARVKQGLPPGIPSSPRQAYPQEFQLDFPPHAPWPFPTALSALSWQKTRFVSFFSTLDDGLSKRHSLDE